MGSSTSLGFCTRMRSRSCWRSTLASIRPTSTTCRRGGSRRAMEQPPESSSTEAARAMGSLRRIMALVYPTEELVELAELRRQRRGEPFDGQAPPPVAHGGTGAVQARLAAQAEKVLGRQHGHAGHR